RVARSTMRKSTHATRAEISKRCIPSFERMLQNSQSLLGRRCELQASDIPLLASPQGGVAASSRESREATEANRAGVVFLFALNRKTTPSALSVDASRHFHIRAAALLAVMQGGECRSPETHSA